MKENCIKCCVRPHVLRQMILPLMSIRTIFCYLLRGLLVLLKIWGFISIAFWIETKTHICVSLWRVVLPVAIAIIYTIVLLLWELTHSWPRTLKSSMAWNAGTLVHNLQMRLFISSHYLTRIFLNNNFMNELMLVFWLFVCKLVKNVHLKIKIVLLILCAVCLVI